MPLLVCTTPAEYSGQSGVIKIKNEEDAAIWLWAEPALLLWRRKVEWLFSPVVGNSGWNLGDLWGIDAEGELLLLENKVVGRGDPFEKFLGNTRSRPEWQADALLQRWATKYRLETTLRSNALEIGRDTQGILPNSLRRLCLNRWPDLAARIDGRIRHDRYVDRVRRFLEHRRAAKSPPPHYGGLFVMGGIEVQGVLERFSGSMNRLEKAAPNRVHLFVARAEAISEEQTQIIVSRRYPQSLKSTGGSISDS